MPGLNDRGRTLKDLCAELRAESLIVRRCAWCPDWQATGTVEDTEAARQAHLLEHGITAKPAVRRRVWGQSAKDAA